MISKLPKVGISIFTQMTGLAQSFGAINLSQGFPGFEPDSLLIERLAYHAAHGKNQYSPASGVPELRKQIGLLYSCDPDTEVTVTSGAAEALFCAIATVVSKDDEVIIIEPAYDLYAPAVETQGAVPVFVQMNYPDFTIDWQKVESKINTKTKLIIVNTPHNPTGKVLKQEDIKALEEIIQRNPELLLVSDEVYEHIVFDEHKHVSLRDSELLRERTFMCSSFAKTFHITGWKMGYCIAPSALTAEFRKVHQYVTFCSFTPAQYALADYLETSKAYLQLSSFYQKKRDLFRKALTGSDFEFLTSEGTFFQNVSFGHLSKQADVVVSKLLTEKLGVASIPTSAFYNENIDHKIIRFCFAKDDETLLQAAERLQGLSRYL
jgi:methionine aminotransferase